MTSTTLEDAIRAALEATTTPDQPAPTQAATALNDDAALLTTILDALGVDPT